LLPSGAPDQADGSVATLHKRQQTRRRPAGSGVIEIVLPNGVVVRVGGDVDQAALGKILAALKSA
jgi:hypothetical protein